MTELQDRLSTPIGRADFQVTLLEVWMVGEVQNRRLTSEQEWWLRGRITELRKHLDAAQS